MSIISRVELRGGGTHIGSCIRKRGDKRRRGTIQSSNRCQAYQRRHQSILHQILPSSSRHNLFNMLPISMLSAVLTFSGQVPCEHSGASTLYTAERPRNAQEDSTQCLSRNGLGRDVGQTRADVSEFVVDGIGQAVHSESRRERN